MKAAISIGNQSFEKIRTTQSFYVDKTDFIREWWEERDEVTLITRPRRFGKTLNMSMMECFFSEKYKGRSDLFKELTIWESEEYRRIQGTYPVIFLSFAGVKADLFSNARDGIIKAVANAYDAHSYLKCSDALSREESANYDAFQNYSIQPSPREKISDTMLASSLYTLSMYLERYHKKKVLIFLDEYDTPLLEAYMSGYWNELSTLIRSMFNLTFKSNISLNRAIMTGITRVSKESIFSDLNNLEVITTTSEKYCTAFGFTEEEVQTSLQQYELDSTLDKVRLWYDGFCFGNRKDIYNPWSITKYLDTKKFGTYWANTSSNHLVSKFIQESASDIKIAMEDLLEGKSIETEIDEEIIFDQLGESSEAIWSLLLASGYLKADGLSEEGVYQLSLTNLEVMKEFRRMIQGWFKKSSARYNDFIKALLENNVGYMNHYMNKMALNTFSFFDSGNHPSEQTEPERFYHGFVLGLIADAKLEYVISSNRESGLGRYDVIMEPTDRGKNVYVFEFKVKAPDSEITLEQTAKNALAQIEEKGYDIELSAKGFSREQIHHYGFAFEGKKVFIGYSSPANKVQEAVGK